MTGTERQDLGLFTDLYQLTMLDAYLQEGMQDDAVFTLFVRRLPNERKFLLAAGLDPLLETIENLSFSDDDLRYLKEQNPNIDVWLADPDGSGIFEFLRTGEYVSNGSSMTEGIGIMRLVDNFRQARIDHAVNLPDQDLISISRYVREQDGLVLGSSSALNLAAAFAAALNGQPGRNIVTFACDLGERSASKLYNNDYLKQKGLAVEPEPMEQLTARYKQLGDRLISVNWSGDNA